MISASRLRRIRIPSGSTDGYILRIPGGSGGGDQNGTSDLVVQLEVRPHPVLSRDGFDLRAELPLAVAEVVLGSSIRLTTPYGEAVRVTVPPGTNGGTVLRVPDRGISDDGHRGDLLLRVKTGLTARPVDGPREIAGGWIVEEVGDRFPDAVQVVAVTATRPSLEWAGDAVLDLTGSLARTRRPVVLLNLYPSAAGLDGRVGARERPGFADVVAGRVSLPEIARRVPDGGFAVLPAGASARRIATLEGKGNGTDGGSREIELVERLLASPHLRTLGDRIRNIREGPGALVALLPAGAAGAAAATELFDGHLSLGPRTAGEPSSAWKGLRSLGAIREIPS